MQHYILDKNKRAVPVDYLTYTVWINQGEEQKRRVALSESAEYHISTVFLGFDHSYEWDNEPILFETLVTKPDCPYSEYTERYSTWDEAVRGHLKFCEKYCVHPEGYLSGVHDWLLKR